MKRYACILMQWTYRFTKKKSNCTKKWSRVCGCVWCASNMRFCLLTFDRFPRRPSWQRPRKWIIVFSFPSMDSFVWVGRLEACYDITNNESNTASVCWRRNCSETTATNHQTIAACGLHVGHKNGEKWFQDDRREEVTFCWTIVINTIFVWH